MSEEPRVVPAPEIAEPILEFIRRELVSPGDEIDAQDDLLSGELLDSLSVLRLSTFVEEQFKIRIQPSDFVVENFQNVEALTRFVQRARSPSESDASHPRS